jgi:CheY-like chemotaxis protein
MTPARILIVDDDADFRWLLLTLLEADSRVRVAGEAGEVMLRSDGLEATRRIKQAAPERRSWY